MFGQSIQVLDIESEFPIDRVLVYNKSKITHVYTDKDGRVDLSMFSDKEILYFQHLAYTEISFSKSEIQALNGKVYLEIKSELIEEVVLSASRNKEKRNRIAEHIEVISQHKITLISPQTSADLLALTPGVKVQKSQFGGGSPILRGMESNRVLLVVDGVRMNNAIYRKGHLQNSITVSPNLLSRTEVLFGPSSIIYGSDALGGVIHYYTRKPLLNDKNLFSSTLLTRYSSVNDEITMSFTGEFSSKKWASLTGVSISQFGDLKMGKNRAHGFTNWGLVPFYSENSPVTFVATPTENPDENIQKNTGFKQIDLLQKFLIPLNTQADLCLNFQYSNSTDIPRFDKLNEYKNGSLRYAEWYYGPQKRFLASAQLSILPDLKWVKDGKITLAYQDIYESRNSRGFGSLEKSFRNENVKVASLNGDFHIPLTQDDKRILSYGFETSYNKVKSKAIGRVLAIDGNHVTGFANDFTIQSRYPDGGSSYTNFALYTNYRLDHSKKGTLNLGVRYTYTFLKAKWVDDTFIRLPDMDISLYNSAFSGTLGYAYKPTKKWQLNVVLSSGFRSPNIDDVGKIREKKGNLTIPNTNLKPEYAYNAEIGVLHLSDTKKTMFGFNTFYMLLTNYITRDFYTLNGNEELLYDGSMSRLQANINKGTAYVVGTTLSFQSKISEHFKINASSTYTKGQTYDTEEPLSSIPPLFGDTSVTYHLKKWDLALNFRFNARKRPEDYNITEGIDNFDESMLIDEDSDESITKYYGTPSWQIFSFSTQYKLSKIATLHLNIDNILDQHYKEFASGISAPGRNVSIVLNAHF